MTGRSGLAAVGAWLVDPAAAAAEPALGRRPVIAVFGLARGCGATVVARGVAAALATRDPAGAAVVSSSAALGGVPLASRPATRLAGVLADVPGASTRAVGRLCLVGGAAAVALADTACHHAPLVLDAGTTAAGGAPASIADRVVLVATPRLEPALARVVVAGLARVGPEPLLVLNQVDAADPRWAGTAHVLPRSRAAARVVVAGHVPRGAFGRALREVAKSCGGVS